MNTKCFIVALVAILSVLNAHSQKCNCSEVKENRLVTETIQHLGEANIIDLAKGVTKFVNCFKSGETVILCYSSRDVFRKEPRNFTITFFCGSTKLPQYDQIMIPQEWEKLIHQ